MKLKQVVNGQELKTKMQEAINLLCDTVKITLGPKGNNVIIDHSNFSPFITNDGVTIAQNIESDDNVINTILNLAKEASIKTNETVGDGTTTTLVLLQSIFNNGLKAIEETNPLLIKKEIDETLKKTILEINKKSKKPTKKQFKYIASISANDQEIGDIISKCYTKVKTKEAIKIVECDNSKNSFSFLEGYNFSTVLASPYFLKDNKELIFNQPYLLLINDYLDDINYITQVLNKIITENKPLVIMALDYSDNLINEIISLFLENELKICLLKNPEYGIKQYKIFKDLSIISNSQIYLKENIKITLGTLKKISITNEFATIEFNKSNKYIEYLKDDFDYTDNELDKEFYLKRLAMFSYGIAEIKVGAPTITERREKKMRFDDALCAIDCAAKGMIPGGGITLLEISEKIESNTIGSKILKEALKEPFKQIMQNSVIDHKSISNKIKENNYSILFNVTKNEFENINKTQVLDPTLVLINSLINACSIATMLLTTSSLVINEYNPINKNDEY